MDVVLNLTDHYLFTPFVYPRVIPEDNIWRQFLSLNVVAMAGGALLYVITATLSFIFIFDKDLLKHPQILEVSEAAARVHTGLERANLRAISLMLLVFSLNTHYLKQHVPFVFARRVVSPRHAIVECRPFRRGLPNWEVALDAPSGVFSDTCMIARVETEKESQPHIKGGEFVKTKMFQSRQN